jgi:nucleoside-diphosphate-sugar epimerase
VSDAGQDAGPKKLWVGGATGFLGAHLVRVLRAEGHQVVLAARSGGEVDGLPVQRVNVLDANAVAESARGCSGGFLATGKVSRDRDAGEELHEAHVLATRSALAGLREAGVRRVVVRPNRRRERARTARARRDVAVLSK